MTVVISNPSSESSNGDNSEGEYTYPFDLERVSKPSLSAKNSIRPTSEYRTSPFFSPSFMKRLRYSSHRSWENPRFDVARGPVSIVVQPGKIGSDSHNVRVSFSHADEQFEICTILFKILLHLVIRRDCCVGVGVFLAPRESNDSKN